MMTFRILPLALTLAAMAGAAGAELNNRFDGTWEGTLKVVAGGCPEFDMVPLTVAIDGGAITATSKVDGSIIARGEVSEFGEATLSGSRRGKLAWDTGMHHLRISGRFRGDGFEGAGKILRISYNNCQARLTLNRTQMAATAEARMAATASPPPAAAAISPPPTAAPIAAAPDKTAAAGPFDGTWEGTLKVVTNSCPKFDMVPLTVVIDGAAITATSKVDGSLMARGEVSEYGEATLAGSKGGRHLQISGRFSGDGFEGAGKIFRPYNNCEARLALNRTQMAATAEARMAATASPPPAAAVTSPPPAATPIAAAEDKTPPAIHLPTGFVADGAVVEIAGRVEDRSLVAEVTVDGRPIPVAADGSFRVRRAVPVGSSSLKVAALDEWGNRAEHAVTVTRKPEVAAATAVAARDTTPPVITAPPRIETQAAMIELAGSLADDSGIVEFSVDGRPVPFGADGGFSVRRGVPLGESRLALVAVDAWGNRAERELRVIRRRPVAQTLTVKRDEAAPVIDVPAMLETETAAVELVGKVSDASRVVELALDGRPVELAADGGFSVRRGVPLGRTTLQLAAVDEWGNRSVRQVQVSRLTPAQALGIDPGRYHALVIGNDTYRDMPKLNTAVADARAVAATLERDYGFQVELLEDATGYQIKSSISRLRRTLTENDNLLVYYAGHGVLDREAEAGFWLPVDAERDSDANWIANDYLTRNLRAMSAKHVMVVTDSCFSGTLVRAAPTAVRSGRERNAWLARMAGKKSRTALVSGGLEPVMDAGGGDHSVFAKAFLEALAENHGLLDGQALFARIQRPVIVNSEQTPDYADIRRAGHDGGDFLFVRQ